APRAGLGARRERSRSAARARRRGIEGLASGRWPGSLGVGRAAPPWNACGTTMKIYTKTGDTGERSLYGGRRVSRAGLGVGGYGPGDGATAGRGVGGGSGAAADVGALLVQSQSELFVRGSELACPPERVGPLRLSLLGAAEV